MKREVYMGIIISIMLLCSCSPSPEKTNYIGMTRKEIATMCANYQKFASPNENRLKKIMIGINNGYRYYDTVDNILKDSYTMNAKSWDINFIKGRTGILRIGALFYYRVTFKNNVVIAQQQGHISDGF